MCLCIPYTLTRPPQRWECQLIHKDPFFPPFFWRKFLRRLVSFLNPVRICSDLLLTLYVLTWTMYLWGTLGRPSLCHFDVWSSVSKMYRTVPLTSTRGKKQSSELLKVCLQGFNPNLALLKFFFLNVLIEFSLTESRSFCFVLRLVTKYSLQLFLGASPLHHNRRQNCLTLYLAVTLPLIRGSGRGTWALPAIDNYPSVLSPHFPTPTVPDIVG